jgi:hydrogenase maturation protein HypF
MLKNSIAVGRGTRAYLSQYIGDLENEETYRSLVYTAEHLLRLFDIEPEAAVCDMHPDYLSTGFAESLGLPVIRVQHHRAHARACMAENRIERAVSVVYDGVGFGEDGDSWGGEVFSVSGEAVERTAHFSYMPMPGGDVCVEHPLRLAAAVLHQRGIGIPGTDDVIEMLEKNVNVRKTCAVGRLFDAAAALTGVCTHQTYEGQAPMEFEAACAPLETAGAYEPSLDCADLLEQVYRDTDPPGIRAARFHNTLIEITARTVCSAASASRLNAVCFSGGCFQNVLLLEGVLSRLKGDLTVYRHRLVPPNDGCIALGQLAEASFQRA